MRTARGLKLSWILGDQLGINQRHYYRLRSQLGARDEAGELGNDEETLRRIRAYLEVKERRRAARNLLILRGFTPAAARKRIQRGSLAGTVDGELTIRREDDAPGHAAPGLWIQATKGLVRSSMGLAASRRLSSSLDRVR